MIDADAIAAMKRGVRVINLARGEIVDDEAMLTALDTGMVAAYITDFPNNRLLTAPHVIAMPHLGASTPESEQNCAAMAVDTLRDYLESGNIRSSVNLPEMTMDRSGVQRLCVLHKNVPGMLANITSLFGRDGVNVENLSNKSRGDYAYTMVDLGSKVGDNVIEDVRRTANVIRSGPWNGKLNGQDTKKHGFRRAFFFYFVQRAFNCSAVMAQPSAMY